MRIRPYQREDRAACLELFQSNVPTFFTQAEKDEFAAFLEAPQAEFLVVETAAGELVGCGGYYVRGTEGRLCWGMVHRERHRAGIGTALLQERLKRLRQHADVTSVAISTSQHSAPFFARFGFHVKKQVPNGFGEGIDEVEMTLAYESEPC